MAENPAQGRQESPRLLVISSAPAHKAGGRLRLDVKFVEGMRFYASSWAGPVDCFLPETASPLPFVAEYDPAELPFGIRVLAQAETLTPDQLGSYDVILCSGDGSAYLDLPRICAGLHLRIYYVIEYILETRLQIIFLDPRSSALRKLRRVVWTLMQERRRRHAFRAATGLQANGYPAAEAYRRVNANTLVWMPLGLQGHFEPLNM